MVGVCIQCTEEQAEALSKLFKVVKIIRPKEKQEPTLDNILAFCQERNSPVDGMRFYNYYQPRGWIDASGKKIEDWRSKIIEWEKNGKNNNQRNRIISAAEYEAKGMGKHDPQKIQEFMDWAKDFCSKSEAKKEECSQSLAQ